MAVAPVDTTTSGVGTLVVDVQQQGTQSNACFWRSLLFSPRQATVWTLCKPTRGDFVRTTKRHTCQRWTWCGNLWVVCTGPSPCRSSSCRTFRPSADLLGFPWFLLSPPPSPVLSSPPTVLACRHTSACQKFFAIFFVARSAAKSSVIDESSLQSRGQTSGPKDHNCSQTVERSL